MNYWVIIYRLALGLLIVLFAVGATCVFLPQCNRLRELQRERATVQEDIRHTGELIGELRVKQETFDSDPAFVIRTAGENGMADPKATVFRLPDSPQKGQTSLRKSPISAADSQESPESN